MSLRANPEAWDERKATEDKERVTCKRCQRSPHLTDWPGIGRTEAKRNDAGRYEPVREQGLRVALGTLADYDAALDRIYDIASHLEQEGPDADSRRKGRRIMNIIDQVDEEGEDDDRR